MRCSPLHGGAGALATHEASYRQVRDATRLLQQSRATTPADTRARAERVAQALKAAALNAKVSSRRGRGGAALVNFRDVPMDELTAFARAILAAQEQAEGG